MTKQKSQYRVGDNCELRLGGTVSEKYDQQIELENVIVSSKKGTNAAKPVEQWTTVLEGALSLVIIL